MHVLLPTPPCVHAARAPQPTASGASTAIGLAVLSSVVLVHEAGHFSAAAFQKMRVEEFSIGFGPRIFALRPREGGVRYVLRALPLGGYVAFPRAGEAAAAAAVQSAAEDEGRGWRWWRKNPSPPAPPPGAFDASDPALFENRPFPQQAAVVSAGVIANLLLAWSALFGSAVSLGVPPSPPVTVSRVVAGGAAGAHSATSPPPLRHLSATSPPPALSAALSAALSRPPLCPRLPSALCTASHRLVFRRPSPLQTRPGCGQATGWSHSTSAGSQRAPTRSARRSDRSGPQ